MIEPYASVNGATLYLGDARLVLSDLPGPIDLVVTDPPYASGARRDAEKTVRGKTMLRSVDEDEDWFQSDSITGDGYHFLLCSAFYYLRRLMAEGSQVFLFCDWRQQGAACGVLESVGFRVNQILVWDKIDLGMGSHFRNQFELVVYASLGKPRPIVRRDVGSVIRCKTVRRDKMHPTEKPVSLLRRLISVTEAKTVIDPFCGSGATLEAALLEGRSAIGIDVDPRYAEESKRRIEGPRQEELFGFD